MNTGTRFFASIYARLTGDNLIAEGYRRKRSRALARAGNGKDFD